MDENVMNAIERLGRRVLELEQADADDGATDHGLLQIQPFIMGMVGTDWQGREWVTFLATFERRCNWCDARIKTGWNLRESDLWVCSHHFDVEGKH